MSDYAEQMENEIQKEWEESDAREDLLLEQIIDRENDIDAEGFGELLIDELQSENETLSTVLLAIFRGDYYGDSVLEFKQYGATLIADEVKRNA